jgi:hypothetical protein
MDRSFLSAAEVVAASRRFVCIRLLTYESAEEAKVLKSLFVGRSGQLENTTFALLASDGATKLARAGRSPDFAFRGGEDRTGAQEMAAAMSEIAFRHERTETGTLDATALPLTKTVRLALDVAACDGLPLVVAFGDDAAKRAALAERLAGVSWRAPSLGRFVYAVAGSADELKPIDGSTSKSGVVVVQPDAFGASGKVLAQCGVDADAEALAKTLAAGLQRHVAQPKDPRTHIDEGRRLGIRWQTVIPETDPGPRGAGPPPGGGR